jgi:hypothetical protein
MKMTDEFSYLRQQIETAEKNRQPIEKYVIMQIYLLK